MTMFTSKISLVNYNSCLPLAFETTPYKIHYVTCDWLLPQVVIVHSSDKVLKGTMLLDLRRDGLIVNSLAFQKSIPPWAVKHK